MKTFNYQQHEKICIYISKLVFHSRVKKIQNSTAYPSVDLFTRLFFWKPY